MIKTYLKPLAHKEKFDEAALQLGDEISSKLLLLSDKIKAEATEIRIRCGQPVGITLYDGTYISDGQYVSGTTLNNAFSAMCRNAIYSRQDEIASGCITLIGGHRVGICGCAVKEGNKVINITDISSVCIRIAHEFKGCAELMIDKICLSKGFLLAGPPCSGKTTLMRDLARIASYKKSTVIVDELNEIAAVYKGEPQLDVGASDVITGFSRAEGMVHALRFLSPGYIFCDEISTPQEANAINTVFNAGSAVVAAVHCGSLAELKKREVFQMLKKSGAFGQAAILSREHPGCISEIIDFNDL